MKLARMIAFGVLGTILVAQLVRPAITNPPVVAEPHWDSKNTRDLVRRACFDCHSNETVTPWYAQVAPVRWLVASHVNEGRSHLNFSEPSSEYELDEMLEEIGKGAMPTWDYKLLHASARLSKAEQDSLVAGLQATFGGAGKAEDSASESGEKPHEEENEENEEHEGKGHKEHKDND